MKKFLFVLLILVIFSISAAPVFAKCPKAEVTLKHVKDDITLKISGSPEEIINADGSKRCPTSKEILDHLLKIFPEFILKEYREFGYSN